MDIVINISRDYSETPGGRYIVSGPFSGEDFRDNFLIVYLDLAISSDANLVLDLDGGYGYPSCFLEEVFGGLVRLGYDSNLLLERIVFISNEEPTLIQEIKEYIKDAGNYKLSLNK